MASSKNQTKTMQQIQNNEQKQQMILFFKSYLKYLKNIMSNSHSKKEQNNSIFDLKKTSVNVSLELFLQRVLSYFKCGTQAYLCALCLIDRLLISQNAKTDNIVLSIKNIFKILSVALLISTKNFDDFYYSNTYYARVCGLTLQQLNTLEKQFLKIIDFDVFVDSDDYKIYETRINIYKRQIIEQIWAGQGKQNILTEENRTMNQKRNKLNLRPSYQNSQQEEQTNVEVEVSA